MLLLTARCRAEDGREWVSARLDTGGLGHASGQIRGDKAGQGAMTGTSWYQQGAAILDEFPCNAILRLPWDLERVVQPVRTEVHRTNPWWLAIRLS